MTTEPTTACLMTAPARGGIAVIVLAGPRSQEVLARVFRPRGRPPAVGTLSLGWIVRDGQTLDEAVVAFEPKGPRAEINVHGGPQVGRAVLAWLAECGAEIVPTAATDPAFARPAAGIDNPAIAAEILAALRAAATPLAASAVTCQWSGGLSELCHRMLAGPIDATCARPLLAAAEGLPLMRRLLEPAEVVIAGPPNVGKSALANALAGRNVSIVCDTPGTTRDWVRTLIDADGVPVWLTDTAGLWEAADGVDAEAVRRAWERIASAELVLCVTAGPPGPWAELVARVRALPNVLHLAGKCDIAFDENEEVPRPAPTPAFRRGLFTSPLDGDGASIAPRGSGGLGEALSCGRGRSNEIAPPGRGGLGVTLPCGNRASGNPLLPEGAIEEGPRGHESASIAPCGSGGFGEELFPGSVDAPLPVSGKTLAGIDALRRAIRDRLGFCDFDPRRPMAFTDRQAELLRRAAHAARSGSPEDTKKNLRELLCA